MQVSKLVTHVNGLGELIPQLTGEFQLLHDASARQSYTCL